MPGVALSFAFFLSGAAGLIFQVVWFHRAGLVLGSSVSAVTVVLSAFMGGLALGNALSTRIVVVRSRALLIYAVLEHAVAVSGVLVTVMLPHLSGVVAAAAQASTSSVALDVARFGSAFALMVIPATAMGATLPLLVSVLSNRRESFGAALGQLYGWNTLGAVAGVLLADVELVARLGVPRTAEVAALLNLVAGWTALAVARRFAREETMPPAPTPTVSVPSAASRSAVFLLLCAAGVSGAAMLALEVVWFRFLSLYALSTTLAASLMVAAVLGGIGAGGLVAARWLRRERPVMTVVPLLAAATGVMVTLSYSAFRWTTSGTQHGEWATIFWCAVALAGPVAMLSGALFTALGTALTPHSGAGIHSAARLTLVNTLGALLGPPLAAFVLLPAIGMEGAFLALSLAYAAVAVLVLLAGRAMRRPIRMPAISVAVSVVLTLAVFPFGTMRGTYFPRAAQAYAADGSTILQTREGPSETIFLMAQQWHGLPVYHRLVTNGFSMTGTGVPGLRYMRAFAYWPMVLHKGPLEHALLLCYGVGVTAGAALQIPSLTSLDVVEISPDVVAMSDTIYAGAAHPLRDPRTTLHIEDGRFFLETTDRRFDLITGEPPPPRTPGTVNIYTEEYFRLVRERLTAGGIASYWVPVARPNPGTDIDTVIRAFCNVFDDCSLWNATPFDFMLIGSRDGTGPLAPEAFDRPWQTPGLQASLREVGLERPEQIGATFLGDAPYLRSITAQTPPLTDDFPQRLRPSVRLSLSDPRYASDSAVSDYYRRVLDPARARQAFAESAFVTERWPTALRQRTEPFFDTQRMLNDALWDGGRPLGHIDDLARVLTATSLRTLPLWMLGTDDVKLRLAEQFDDGTGAMEYAKALRGFSGRDYRAAATYLERAKQRGLSAPPVAALQALALYLAGDREASAALASAARPQSDEEREFWEWIRARVRQERGG